ISAWSIQVVGGVSVSGTARLSPAPTTPVPFLADPLAALPVPSVTTPDQGTVTVSNGMTRTINPGIYDQISVSGSGRLTLSPGVYVIKGGGLTVSNSGVLTGSGVVIYNAGSNYPAAGGNFGGVTLGGAGTITLSAPTGGPYTGVTVFQQR